MFKEYLIAICKEAFDPEAGLFKCADDDARSLYPDPSYLTRLPPGGQAMALSLYEFLGRMVGKPVCS